MTYPDGEVVDYTYNRAGNLQSMQGKKESHTYDYIKQLAYDEFEQRKYLKYGNDTETNYNYDPTMRRLQQLQVSSSLGRQIMNNSYSYDLVGNVLGIKNVAPVVNNTLGGTSNHEYQYDDFYRLKSAKATYQGEFTKASYELNMSYNKMHNITKKDLVHTVNNEQKGYVLDYTYDNEAHPNAPSYISEVAQANATASPGAGGRTYTYDGNGNPTYIEGATPSGAGGMKMTWDEENRLMGINDNGRIHQYTYDAGGERVIKSSGDSQHIAVNGQTAATIVHTDDYTGYVSPYFVISKGKFTKHYFEGAGRIVSKLGNGAFAQPLKITAGGVNYTQRTAAEQKALDAYVKTLGVPPGPPTQQGIYATPEFTGDPYPSEVLQPVEENQEPPEGWPRNPIFNAPGDVPGPPVQFGPPVEPATVLAAEGFTGIGLPENDIFYFHPDHLGSTSYISTRNGSISQHVEYIAFGEILFEEHSSSFSSPYLFNGKELDRETNLSYYGARYLDMKTSLWLSVDPLAEKFSNQSPYSFCFNNPIRYTDPTGMAPDDFVQRNDGSIYWDNNANSKATTKSGETYLGKELTFNFNSYIDSKLWDGPMGDLPAGDKLTSTIKITGNENSKGVLTSISASKSVKVGDTPMGTANDYYPGEGGNNNTFGLTKSSTGIDLNFEQHASVSPIEEFGMNRMGYKIVDVAQKLEINYNSRNGNLSVSSSTGVFPSATLSVNGNEMMKYNQPSFVKTHTAPSIKSTYLPGQSQGRDFSYYPTKFYKR
ncbi:hypothetical protein BJQ96_03686 [Flavobacterium sp. PL0002]|nr:RHS repeat-associated core domain-containing protein [Flavobacterium sp. PL002]MBE0393813.1 hypothetical protein [Flavobacterium sp. PL002]